MVFPVGKGIKVGAVTGIIIPITGDLVHNHHKNSVKAAGVFMVISMALNHPPKISHLMPHNPILMVNTRNAPNIRMIMGMMSKKVVITMRMWVTCLLRTSKQL